MCKLIMFLATAAAVLALLASGCGASKTADTGTHSLADTSWVLVSYGDPASLKPVIAGTKVTLNFNAATNQISGNGGVNGYGGDARHTDNQLTLSGILHTEMASVNQAINEQENAYFQLLGAARSVEFGTSSLTIHCEGKQLLVFNAG
jgi:heat shock protein HslJ